MIVGLTGGIGSGKSTVLSFFKEKENVVTYIADERAKWLMHNSDALKKQLLDLFGNQVYENGLLNRKLISSIVFENPKMLSKLNMIVHPAVRSDFEDFVSKNPTKIIVYESAILFEVNSHKNCDLVITVFMDLQERIKRVIERDSVNKEEVLKRINNQYSDTKRNLQSNYLIYNNSLSATKSEVDRIYNILTKKNVFV